MKRIITLILVFVFMLSCVACNNINENVSDTQTANDSEASDVVSEESYGIEYSNEISNESTKEKQTYTVSYDANGGTNAPKSQTKKYGESLTLTTKIPRKEGYSFVEWNSSADKTGVAYKSSSVYRKNEDITLYAVWTKKEANDIPVEAYNIARGIKYTTDAKSFRSDSFGDYSGDSANTCLYKLTDGEKADTGSSGSIGGYSEEGKVVFDFDLGCESTIYSFSIDMFGGLWGVGIPDSARVTYSYSVNGIDYTILEAVSPSLGNASVLSAKDWKKVNMLFKPKSPVTARYVRVFAEANGSHVWCSEIEIQGIRTDDIPSPQSNQIPRVYITTLDNDRVHRSAYHQCTIKIVDMSCKYDTIIDTNGEIKIRGNSTSSGAKQPYNIRFESKQDVLGLGKCKKWYLLANMYDKTLIRNKLAFDLAADIGMNYVQQSVFTEVYLNGKYIGMYQLCESIGVGNSRVDIDETENEFLLEYEPWPQYSNEEWIYTPVFNILFGFNAPDHPTKEQRIHIEDLLKNAELAIESKDINRIKKFIDIDSFVDAYLVQEFFKQVDYSTSSTRFYIKDGKLYQGPVWDFDLSSGNCSSTYYTAYNNIETTNNSYEGLWCQGIWNGRLFECEEIYKLMTDRYKELQPILVNIYSDNSLGKNKIDALTEKYRKDIEKNYTVWSASTVYSDLERIPTDGTYESEIRYLRNWFKKRNEWLLDYFGIKQ